MARKRIERRAEKIAARLETGKGATTRVPEQKMIDLWIIVYEYDERCIQMLTSRRSTRRKKKRERRERK